MERRNEKADLEGKKRRVGLRIRSALTSVQCADRQVNANWPTLPSYTHANDAHASRPRTPQGQVYNFGQKTERALKKTWG